MRYSHERLFSARRRRKGGARKLFRIEPERRTLRRILPDGQRTGHRFGRAFVSETRLIAELSCKQHRNEVSLQMQLLSILGAALPVKPARCEAFFDFAAVEHAAQLREQPLEFRMVARADLIAHDPLDRGFRARRRRGKRAAPLP